VCATPSDHDSAWIIQSLDSHPISLKRDTFHSDLCTVYDDSIRSSFIRIWVSVCWASLWSYSPLHRLLHHHRPFIHPHLSCHSCRLVSLVDRINPIVVVYYQYHYQLKTRSGPVQIMPVRDTSTRRSISLLEIHTSTSLCFCCDFCTLTHVRVRLHQIDKCDIIALKYTTNFDTDLLDQSRTSVTTIIHIPK
jgi:hypothetical protein